MAGSSISLPAVKTQEGKRLCNAFFFFFPHRGCADVNFLC